VNQTAKHVIFKGHVQGVGFRYTANDIARGYDLTGFVRNLPDGTVELFMQGPARNVDNCLKDIQDTFSGYIRDTRVEPVPPNSRYSDFRITF
jgi:acylphosphatase